MPIEQDKSIADDRDTPKSRTGVFRPHIGPFEALLLLWRAKWLMVLVFLPLVVLGLLAVMQLPKTYKASSRIQVSLGREYVYEPVIGDAGAGVTLESEAVVRAEVAKVYSPVVMRSVLDEFSLAAIYPDLAEQRSKAQNEKERIEIYETALAALQQSFSAGASPKSPVITVSFEHKDPQTAADVTNAIVEEYFNYRLGLTSDASIEPVARQRREFSDSLAQAEENIRAFLIENRIGDFDTERLALGDRLASITNELLQVRASQREAQARLSALQNEMNGTPEEIELYVDTSGDEQLLQLQIEREQLLGRYRPESQPVRELDARIANLRQLLQSSEGGVRRRGQNPSFADLESRVAIQRSELTALRSRAAELERQQAEVETRQMELTNLLPTYQHLTREQSVLETSVQNLAAREQTRRATNELNTLEASSITRLEPAFPPTKGKSMKLIGALATGLFAGFTALMAGLAYALTRKGMPTRNSVERTLGLPVIGAMPRYKARRA